MKQLVNAGQFLHIKWPNTIINGPYKDMTLDQLWSQHRELFDNDSRDSFLC